MSPTTATPSLANIRLHPIKSLDPISVPQARISPSGGLELDRAWALYSVDGRWVNGKRTPAIHLIRAAFSPDLRTVTLTVPGDRRSIPAITFPFPDGHADAAEWFSMFFEQQIIVRYSPGGFPDDTIANGPTIVSTASLQAVADWFPGLSVDDIRLRFRTSLEIDGVPAFWEDQLFGERGLGVLDRDEACGRRREHGGDLGVVGVGGSESLTTVQRLPERKGNPASAASCASTARRARESSAQLPRLPITARAASTA